MVTRSKSQTPPGPPLPPMKPSEFTARLSSALSASSAAGTLKQDLVSSARSISPKSSSSGRCGRAPINCRRPRRRRARRGACGSTWAGAVPARRARVPNGCAPRRWGCCRGRCGAPHRARRRDDRGGAPRDDRGRVGALERARRGSASALRAVEGAARLAVGRHRAGVLGGGPRRLARAAVRCRLVRRGRQVAPSAKNMGHAAVRAAARARIRRWWRRRRRGRSRC